MVAKPGNMINKGMKKQHQIVSGEVWNPYAPGNGRVGGQACTIPCNLCGSASLDVLSLRDRKGAYLRTVICKKCGLIRSDPRPDDDIIKEFYSKGYRREYKGITVPKKKHVYRAAREAVRRYRFIGDLIQREDRLLDIGAGNGAFVYCLRRLGYDAEGVDPDKNHSRYAREVLEIPITTGFSSDVRGQAVYDMITLHHVLEHMMDPYEQLRHVRTLLKPDGRLVVEVPNAEDIRQDPQNRYHKAHLYTFNPETLIALGSKAGFAVVRKSVAPLNGNIAVIFQKADAAFRHQHNLSGNHRKILLRLNRHTNFKHFTSSVPYVKIVSNLINAMKEFIAVGAFFNHKDIINKVLSDEIGDDPTA